MTNQSLPEESIFLRSLEIASAEERAAYLDLACGQDARLRAEVESLLRANQRSGDLLDLPESPAAFDQPITEQQGSQTGPYKLREKIGEGGMGIVYVADQTEPVKRRVALKLIKPGMDSKQVLSRFESERQALAVMDHPNIARIFDAGMTEAGRSYFAMELVRGIPITEFCDEQRLSGDERLRLFLDVCRAVQHAHQKGIIHRDLKPSNVLVTCIDGKPVVKVIDFGLAKATTGQPLADGTVYTGFMMLMGTPAYMSPEQTGLSGVDVDTRSDIYSLGVLLYELLTGSTPLEKQTLDGKPYDEVCRLIREQEAPKPSHRLSTLRNADRSTVAHSRRTEPAQIVRELKEELDWILMKALEKDRARRYETATAFAEDIQRHLQNEPVTAVAPSPWYLATKAVQRHKAALTTAASFLALLIAGAAVSTVMAVRANQAVAETRKERDQTQLALQAEQAAKKLADAARELAEISEQQTSDLLYCANLNWAQAAFHDLNYRRTQQLLEETRDHSKRGWEWYYWQRRMHGEVKTIQAFKGEVSRVAFSPDAQRIATASPGAVIVWDTQTGEEQLRFRYSYRWGPNTLAFSPDGAQILLNSANPQDALGVWDATTGEKLYTKHAEQSGDFSPDGKLIASASGHAINIWDAKTGERLRSFANASLGGDVESVRFTSDGQGIFVVEQKGASIRDAMTGELVRIIFQRPDDEFSAKFLSHDGKQMIRTELYGQDSSLWDATATDQKLGEFPLTENGGVAVCFSPDDKWVVAACRDYTARIWDTTTREETRRLEGHTGPLRDVALSHDGRWVATACEDGTVRIWDLQQQDNPQIAMEDGFYNNVAVCATDLSPDGRLAVTPTGKGAFVWEVDTGRLLHTLDPHPDNTYVGVWSAHFSPDGSRIVISNHFGTAAVFDVATGERLVNLIENAGPLVFANYSPNGEMIVVAGNGHARILDAKTGRQWHALEVEEDNEIRGAVFSPDNEHVVTAGNQGTQVWEVATGRMLYTWPNAGVDHHSSDSVAYSPDGRRLAIGQNDGDTTVWDAASFEHILTLSGHKLAICSVEFSADGKRILTASHDKTARLWDTETGRELLALEGHGTVVYAATFFPDGQRILTTGWSEDRVLIWEAATLEQVAKWDGQQDSPADGESKREGEAPAEPIPQPN